MEHPGSWLTITCAVTSSAWGIVGSTYTRHRLRPVRRNATLAKAHAEAARSSRPRWVKRAYLDKANRLVAANAESLKGTQRWIDRVYTPVLVVLAGTSVVLAVWGVL